MRFFLTYHTEVIEILTTRNAQAQSKAKSPSAKTDKQTKTPLKPKNPPSTFVQSHPTTFQSTPNITNGQNPTTATYVLPGTASTQPQIATVTTTPQPTAQPPIPVIQSTHNIPPNTAANAPLQQPTVQQSLPQSGKDSPPLNSPSQRYARKPSPSPRSTKSTLKITQASNLTKTDSSSPLSSTTYPLATFSPKLANSPIAIHNTPPNMPLNIPQSPLLSPYPIQAPALGGNTLKFKPPPVVTNNLQYNSILQISSPASPSPTVQVSHTNSPFPTVPVSLVNSPQTTPYLNLNTTTTAPRNIIDAPITPTGYTNVLPYNAVGSIPTSTSPILGSQVPTASPRTGNYVKKTARPAYAKVSMRVKKQYRKVTYVVACGDRHNYCTYSKRCHVPTLPISRRDPKNTSRTC